LALAQAEEKLLLAVPAERVTPWGDLRIRVMSAAVMVPVALGCIWIGGAAFAVLVAVLAIGMAFEWLTLCQVGFGPRQVLMFAALPLAVLVAALGQAGSALGLLGVVTAVACVRLGTPGRGRLLPFGIPYIGLGAAALVWLRAEQEHGRGDVVILLLVIWATDIGAYVVGRAVGGPRLAPKISPGKTWSGAVGGLFAGMAVGALAALFGNRDGGWLAIVASSGLAAVIGTVGQAGDLFESLLKRRFEVKDSGFLIPGHGGVLDRLDAVLTAAPAAALLALLLGRGVVNW
jgi:phosphatidate cytidylyltransferase